MRTYRNAEGRVVVPTYGFWGAENSAILILGITLGMAYNMVQRQLGLNDWEMREVIRMWLEREQ